MLKTGQISPDVIDYLKARRSATFKEIGQRAPTKDEIAQMLEIAARVPDHGRLFPWYFIVFDDTAREEIGGLLREAYLTVEPDASPDKLNLEAQRFMRAPLVVLVVSRVRPGKKVLWEQVLSAGASCYNLGLAASALGYGSNWVTEWYSSNAAFKAGLGLDARDHIAGAVYIGDVLEIPEERPRPDMAQLTTFWRPGTSLNKGDGYDAADKPFPEQGFKF